MEEKQGGKGRRREREGREERRGCGGREGKGREAERGGSILHLLLSGCCFIKGDRSKVARLPVMSEMAGTGRADSAGGSSGFWDIILG